MQIPFGKYDLLTVVVVVVYAADVYRESVTRKLLLVFLDIKLEFSVISIKADKKTRF